VWSLAALLAAASLSRLVPVSRAQLAAPFDLISEGPHLCTVQAIARGVNIYARQSFLGLPFFMTPYTPLYHVLVAALPQDPANPFFTGRLVAAAFMVASAAVLLATARVRRPLAIAAIAAFFLIHAVTGNTVYLRSDAVALCWSVWAVVAASRARSSRGALAAGVLCGLALAAKQSFVAAGIACFIHFVRHAPRRLRAFFAGGAAVVLVLAAAATAEWGRDFWLAVTIPVTDYPRDIESFFVHWRMMFAQPIFLWLVGAALLAIVTSLRRDRRVAFATPFFPYVLVAWACQTWVMTGIGAENHNLNEPVLATLLWLVAVEDRRGAVLRLGWTRAAALVALAGCVAFELRNPDPATYAHTDTAKTARYMAARERVNAWLRARSLEHGRMLNLKNSQVVHDYVGDFVVNDVWMYITVLWNSRPETVDGLVRAIEREEFDAIFVSPGVLSPEHDVGNAPWPRIIHAVFAHYAVALRGEEVNVLLRRERSATGPRARPPQTGGA